MSESENNNDANEFAFIPETIDGNPGSKQLVLVKDGQRYVFRYALGEEAEMLGSLMEMAGDPNSQLDWFDAAVLSHQMGRRMSDRLNDIIKPPRKTG